MVQYNIKLEYQLKRQKKVWGILLKKLEKQNLDLIKLYQVINLFNYLRKGVKKVVADLLSEFCKMFFKLYLEQKKGQKQ